LVEAAFMLPVFIFLVFGIVEGGLLMRDNLTLAAMTTDAARSAAVFGNDAKADYGIIQQLKSSATAINISQIERIVVFKATGPNDTLPTTCRDGTPQTGADACNVYGPSWLSSTDPTQFDCSATSPAKYYCPTDRKIAVTSPPDYVGLFVRLRHDPVTLFFGGSRMLDRTVITRLEPQLVNAP
jgi:Flp pilus assembly protein TadG